MLSLKVDGKDVHLKSDVSFEIVKENPFFTKSGEYTYDIEIDLNDRQNRVVYGHLERMHAGWNIEKRRAVLMDGPHVLCEGTEVVLEKEGDVLKIQIVADNSELNYLSASDDTSVRDLDLGSAEEVDASTAGELAYKIFPDAECVYPPVGTEESDGSLKKSYNEVDPLPENEGVNYVVGTKFVPQPFVLMIIERVVEKLGYKIAYNSLRNEERWKRLILVNGYDSLEYAKMLPDWSVQDFITYCEQFFNVVFLVDSKDNSLSIVNVRDYYEQQDIEYIPVEDVMADFDRVFDAEEELYINYDNVKYDLPSGEYWSYQCIDEEIMKRCEIVDAQLEDFARKVDDFESYDYKIFRDSRGFYFTVSGEYTRPQVMRFQSLIDDGRENTTDLKIVPARIALGTVQFYGGTEIYFAPIPQYYENASAVSLDEAIKNGGFSENAGTVMQVAFYCGVLPVRGNGESGGSLLHVAPQCVAGTRWYIRTYVSLSAIGQAELSCIDDLNLSLEYRKDRGDFDNGFKIDLMEEHVIRFKCRRMLSPMKIFLINNCKYYCKSLTYNVVDSKLDCIVEGSFFRVNES